MGNRGILHDAARQIVRRWTTKAWVACDPTYQGISRKPLFKEGSYSELFFLDEATALSAGHRPCAYGQRAKYNAFKMAWAAALPEPIAPRNLVIKDVDSALHLERVARGVDKLTYSAVLAELPEGAMFEITGQAFLVHRGMVWRWSFNGYTAAEPQPTHVVVNVLTPRSLVRLLERGYPVAVHASADA